MSTKSPEPPIYETNLSYAWGRAFLIALERRYRELKPLTISIGGFTDSMPTEHLLIRQALDGFLARHGKFSCAVSALTIFPYKHWNRVGCPTRQELFDWYLNRYLPRLKARDSRNRNGTYFERMIAFQGVKLKTGRAEFVTKNQLEQIICDWHRPRDRSKRPRQSALQVACFDPAKDHTGQALRGFPCLQQVSFVYDNTGGLAVNAFYPTQYIFDRAYGNYLGLCHLGHFMAHELGLKLVRLNCFIGVPELGRITKTAVNGLAKIVSKVLSDLDK